jgi:predicted permease
MVSARQGQYPISPVYQDSAGLVVYNSRIAIDARWLPLGTLDSGSVDVQTFWQDLRYAVRLLRKSPSFTAVAILTLALGIGANTVIFSVLDPLLLRKLPVPNADALVFLGNRGISQAADYDTAVISELQAYRHYRDENRVFSGVLAFAPMGEFDITRDGEPSSASGEVVSSNYFTVLGLRPSLGRLFVAQDGDGASGSSVAILSYFYWQHAFRSNPAAIGQTISLENAGWSFDPLQNHAYRIIGVAPPGFFGVEVGRSPDIVIPAPNQGDSPAWVTVLARLKPGVSLEEAYASVVPIYEESVRDSNVPAIEKQQDMRGLALDSVARGLSPVRDKFSLAAQIAMALVALVLLIACVNVANLLFARAISRRPEFTVRMALGACRWRLVRQMLAEAALLGSAGAVAGILVANWTAKSLAAALSTPQLPVQLDAGLNARVLALSAAILALTILLCGLIPALSATRDLASDLKVSGTNAAHAPSSTRFGNSLLAGQIAISAVVLVGAGLLLHSLFDLETYNLGFDADHVLAVTLSGEPASSSFYEQLLDRVRRLPGVRSDSFSALTPLGGHEFGINVSAESHPPESLARAHAFFNDVSPEYFATLGIPLLSGRDFTLQDAGVQPPRTAIINRTMARHYFAAEDPVGRTFKFVEGNRPPMEIVGVAADSTYFDLREKPADFIYLPYGRATRLTALNIRASGNPVALASSVRSLIRSLDRSVTIESNETLRHQVDESLHQDRLIGVLCAVFAALALVLTSVGIYGVLSFQVACRTNEIGIRRALGAQPSQILALFLRREMAVLAAGLATGMAGALAITRLMASMLFGISSTDPFTYAAVALLLLLAVLTALYVSARPAMKVDPIVALRYE